MSTEIFVYSQSRLGKVGAWSRYVFHYDVEYNTQLAGLLYLRAGNDLYVLDEDALNDDGVTFEGLISWPHLDMGSPGTAKQIIGVDVVGYGACTVSLGWDQTNAAAYTTPYAVVADTVTGGMIPIPIMAPSIAVTIVYSGGQAWQLNAANLYMQDMSMGR